jgi:hypothetical protein
MFRSTILALSLFSSAAFAGSHDLSCNVHSDYSLTISPQTLVFVADNAKHTPREVQLIGDRLTVDGAPVALSPHDRAIIAELDSNGRVIINEAKALGLEGIDLARVALTEVFSAVINGDPQKMREFEHKVGGALDRLRARVASANSPSEFDDPAFESEIEQAVEDALPMLIGTVVGIAVSAALTGNEAKASEFERRMDAMGKALEQRLEARAETIEVRADALCAEVARLDELESQLQYRTADGQALNLIEAKASKDQ